MIEGRPLFDGISPGVASSGGLITDPSSVRNVKLMQLLSSKGYLDCL